MKRSENRFGRLMIWFIILVLGLIMVVGSSSRPSKYDIEINSDIITLSDSILKQQVGVTEHPKNSNWGPEVKYYIKSSNVNYAIPYCGAGQFFCLKSACDSLNYSYDLIPFNARSAASSQYWFTHGKQIGIKVDYSPQPNDIIVWRKGSTGKGHVERIISVGEMGWVKTVGFNTSNGKSGSQREGGGVFIRNRHLYNPIGALNIRGLVGLISPPEPPRKPTNIYKTLYGVSHLKY